MNFIESIKELQNHRYIKRKNVDRLYNDGPNGYLTEYYIYKDTYSGEYYWNQRPSSSPSTEDMLKDDWIAIDKLPEIYNFD